MQFFVKDDAVYHILYAGDGYFIFDGFVLLYRLLFFSYIFAQKDLFCRHIVGK